MTLKVTETCRDLAQLSQVAQTACRLFFQECFKAGIKNIFVTETYRSPQRQAYLYQQGRTRPGKVVTWTLNSNHANRRAWDIAVGPPQSLYDYNVLNKAGAIARKLGIIWGGDWPKNIDRPHFEVKSNWQMPKGYKLEGQVIVPSNSKLKVQLIVKDDTEEALLVSKAWNPGSPALRTNAEQMIKQAVKEGLIDKQHLTDIRNGEMTTDRLVGLKITIDLRRAAKK